MKHPRIIEIELIKSRNKAYVYFSENYRRFRNRGSIYTIKQCDEHKIIIEKDQK